MSAVTFVPGTSIMPSLSTSAYLLIGQLKFILLLKVKGKSSAISISSDIVKVLPVPVLTVATVTVAAASAALPNTLSPTVAIVLETTCVVTVVPVLAPLTVVPPSEVASAAVVIAGYIFSPGKSIGADPTTGPINAKTSFATGCFKIL